MTTMRDLLDTLAEKDWCLPGFKPLIDKPIEDIYAGTRYPSLWCVVLAYSNPAIARTVLVGAVHNAANTLAASDLKTKMLSLETTTTEEDLDSLRSWAEPYLYGEDQPELHMALYCSVQFLKEGIPSQIMRPVKSIIAYNAANEEKTLQQAKADFYTFLHGAVDLSTWKGSYI